MLEDTVDLWTEPCDARCITTNGYVKGNGHLVMGAGVAGQAQERYPKFPKVAGDFVKQHGNHVVTFYGNWFIDGFHIANYDKDPFYFVTFPVKHVWYEDADLELIERSAKELMDVLDQFDNWQKVLLPRPGCGNGRLTWGQVEPVISPILDDRVVVIRSPW